jgi:hypothetical protein
MSSVDAVWCHSCTSGDTPISDGEEIAMTETISADYGSEIQARNVVDDLTASGIPRDNIFLDLSHNRVKVMMPGVSMPEVREILQRHRPLQAS